MCFTLIVPIAADSAEYEDTMPYLFGLGSDGIMLCIKSIMGLDLNTFDKIYFTILDKHDKKYFLSEMFSLQCKRLGLGKKCRVHVLARLTSSQPETLYRTIIDNSIEGSVFFKDADSFFESEVLPANGVYIYPLDQLCRVNPQNKSYVAVDDAYYITNIIEKKIIGRFFCAGGYIFKNASDFIRVYEQLGPMPKLYLSHIIYSLLLAGESFRPIRVKHYLDWGTPIDLQMSAGL